MPQFTFDQLPVTKGKVVWSFLKWNGLFINVNKSTISIILQTRKLKLLSRKNHKRKRKLIKEWPKEAIRIEREDGEDRI